MINWIKLLPAIIASALVALFFIVIGQRDKAREKVTVLSQTIKTRDVVKKQEDAMHLAQKEVQNESKKVLEEEADLRARGERPSTFGDKRL